MKQPIVWNQTPGTTEASSKWAIVGICRIVIFKEKHGPDKGKYHATVKPSNVEWEKYPRGYHLTLPLARKWAIETAGKFNSMQSASGDTPIPLQAGQGQAK